MPAPERSPDELRRALEQDADALGSVPSGAAREGVTRAVRRQRLARVAIAAPIVALVLVAGVAFAATTEDGPTTAEVAAGGDGVEELTTTTTVVDGSVTTATAICVHATVVDGVPEQVPCPSTTASLPTCPTGTIVEPTPECVPPAMTGTTPGDPTTEVPATTVPFDEPPATVPTTGTTAPGPAGEPLMCGTISPSGWPTTAAPNPSITECFVAAFERGDPATMVVVSYAIPDTNGGDPAYRHEITYTVLGAGLVEVRTDWSSATQGPVGLVTIERCAGLTGFMYPEVSGCTPA